MVNVKDVPYAAKGDGKTVIHNGKGAGTTIIEGNTVEIDSVGPNTPIIWSADEFTDGTLR